MSGQAEARVTALANALSGVLAGASSADVVCALAFLLVMTLEDPDAPPRLRCMDEALPPLKRMIGLLLASHPEMGVS